MSVSSDTDDTGCSVINVDRPFTPYSDVIVLALQVAGSVWLFQQVSCRGLVCVEGKTLLAVGMTLEIPPLSRQILLQAALPPLEQHLRALYDELKILEVRVSVKEQQIRKDRAITIED